MCVDRAVGLPRGHAANDIAHSETARAEALGFAQGRERICGFARLRDHHRERLRRDNRLAVAVFRPVVDIDGQARHLFDHELAYQRRVPGGAARQNRHTVDSRQLRVGHLHLFEEHGAGVRRHAAQDRLPRRVRLLKDFLEHEVLVTRLLGHHRIPQHALGRGDDGCPAEVRERRAGARQHRHLLVAEKHDVARMAQDGGNIRRDEALPVSEADDDGGAVAHGHDRLGVVRREKHEREQPTEVRERATHRRRKPIRPPFPLDEMRDDFRIGLCDERVAIRLQRLLEREVVLDDAVVHDDDPPRAISVRVRVLFRWTSVRGPSRVTDAVGAMQRCLGDHLLKIRQFASAATKRDDAITHHRHAR